MALTLKEGRPVRGGTAILERPDGVRVPFQPFPTPNRKRPPGSPAACAGFSGGVTVAARATTAVHNIPAEKKRRIYFVGKEAVAAFKCMRMERDGSEAWWQAHHELHDALRLRGVSLRW